MARPAAGGVVLCLLRNDLRWHDNEVLLRAHEAAERVLPVFCFDPRQFAKTYYFGLPRTGAHRYRFIVESVLDIKRTLQARGSDLIVRVGEPEAVVPELVRAVPGVKAVYLQDEVASEEIDVERRLTQRCGVPVKTFWGSTLFHADDLPYPVAAVPDTFTQFRTRVERDCRVRPCLAMPERLRPLPTTADGHAVPSEAVPAPAHFGIAESVADARSAFPFAGGETAALAHVHTYIFERGLLRTYKETRNGLVGADYSSKLSPWLALGCLSPRLVHAEVRRHEGQHGANESTYWLLFELTWRDYFHFVMLKHGNALFHLDGPRHVRAAWSRDPAKFRAWVEGRTGVPFVDANMRELAATGFQSNRGRQNVASFLAKDLKIDWRMGAEYFEQQLIDHDVASNYGNWTYVAGVGNDPRENRKFNMIKQAHDYDPNGDYVRLWCPELRNIRGPRVHTPWLLSPHEQQQAGCVVGQAYPHPIVTDPAWAQHGARSGPRSRRAPEPATMGNQDVRRFFSVRQ